MQVLLNRPERNPKARQRCLDHYGTDCAVCGDNLEARYGRAGRGIIHVHHLLPLADADDERPIDPIRDLRPVCPNCHAVIHSKTPAYTIEEVQQMLRG